MVWNTGTRLQGPSGRVTRWAERLASWDGDPGYRDGRTSTMSSGRIEPWSGPTDIFIYPGYAFRITDALMTNFHLPKSTLLMLVSALMGQARIRGIYAHAIAEGYRFFSYGDASLLIP